jgi:hypothetical protein
VTLTSDYASSKHGMPGGDSSVSGRNKMYDPSNCFSRFVPSRKVSFWERSRARVNRSLMSEKWAVGIVRAPIHTFLDASFVPMVQWVGDCGPLDFLADCFGVVEGDNRFILAERFSYRGSSKMCSHGRRQVRTGRGHITSIAINGAGRIVSEVPAIDTGLHMSYPCTIHDRGSWYLVAEEVSRNRLNLYRRGCDGHWQHLKELLPYAVIDPTVFAYADQWWLFGTTPENPYSELRIWSADKLEGNWQPHSGNPVLSDPRNTRPGGTPFLVGGHLYRPTQNSTKTYGGSVIINRVDALTHHSFEEHPVQEVLPPSASPYQDGIHTLSAFGDWTLIDAKKHVVLPRVVIKNILRKVAASITRVGQS